MAILWGLSRFCFILDRQRLAVSSWSDGSRGYPAAEQHTILTTALAQLRTCMLAGLPGHELLCGPC